MLGNGTVIINGDQLHSVKFNWHEQLTILRRDVQSYGVARYIVSDRNGRCGYAY